MVPLDPELRAELNARLSAKPVSKRLNGRGQKALMAMFAAMDAVLDRHTWVSTEDVARAAGFSPRVIRRLLPAAIAELGLRKHRRGGDRWCLP